MKHISIQNNIGIPKYKQIVESIENAIVSKELVKGSQLPSINSVCDTFGVSRDTVMVAYNQLKTRGIIHSISGKGYYVKSENIDLEQKIFVLFDELNVFKEDLYNAFLKNIEGNFVVDIYFHHFNYEVFSKLIFESIGNYNYYVIMPANLEKTNLIIEKLPKEKVYILDQMHDELADYAAIYQNFEKDMYSNLTAGIPSLKKYNKLILHFQNKQPNGMRNGFVRFCKDNNYEYEIVNSLDNRIPLKGEVYIIPDDRNLIVIMKKIKELGLILSENIGIISYNDTLLKEIIEGGITTISTDFNKMGEKLAKMILNNEKIQIENSNSLILRNSL
ncbi:GntR family transcriptional regulator [Lutibacter sp. HS1-25]|uniref:GntR family transcriptional regulator n=1 Tax=Lutibacter sp. HS1-25 TaxID=2485000 RepID=UPI0010138755|nr:GntR family transcriptional regulator [Lutibacter sp. HS1-25]RXP46344.1 GntR family transcriptional regulator [Lutibacter sp. HS1-25]